MTCDAFGDCGSQKITVIQNTDITDYVASTENVVYEYAPAASTAVGDIVLPDDFCIGLVTDVGLVDDKSFNQAAWTGAQHGAELLGVPVSYIETQDSKDYADNIALYANEGCDVIVTVGFAMAEATAIAAVEYPDINFIGVCLLYTSPSPRDRG